ncbi:spore maturation protein [Intestinibacter bartlettii]|uniref:Spore maturation protein n=2 Tax=Intestinibacter bartlettii TaxID=261299 RepID=A0ABS8CZY9_9FIRM|nr:nucleoside recognition domain-containing protein [Intestinibacter bartlettii]MCB5398103.1 spore maturation protein [Intestinibacter bartlettii]MCB5404677.1 spore maturation protein [Intestinibacter bartlettii]MCB5447050.1 spore maturation protein [Intestinibacter bartlettii]MCB5721375.1 spore maturation protein [Intestinibacter bartlettii]MCB5749777.1 spore maturation protein [Intestinibacter bartlettii]
MKKISKIWFYMIVIGIVGSIYFGNLTELNTVIMSEGSRAIEFTISLAAIMALWMGIMNIAKDSGLIDKIGQKMNFILKALFPKIPQNHKSMSYIIMNIILNMLGAGNGATSFGLKAMEELQTLNPKKDRASNEMILFLVINISSIQLIPFTMLKIRADAGSTNPNEIIISTLVATTVSTIVAIISCKFFERGNR